MVDVPKTPSLREQVQDRLVAHLTAPGSGFDAPYGVIPSLRKFPKGGAIRTVTFGVRRTLDASALIYAPDNIVVEGQGAMARHIVGHYSSVDDLVAALGRLFS